MPILPLARSLESNGIGDEGASALATILKETMISNLKCAAAPECSLSCQRPLTLPPSLGSLADNQLCGLDYRGNGTYTAEGITKLCEGLKGSAVTSLECATTTPGVVRFLCQCPLTLLSSRLLAHARSLMNNGLGPDGAAALAEDLKGNSTLRSLE